MIRLLLARDGSTDIQALPLPPLKETIEVHLARTAIDSQNVFLFHKTTRRDAYETARSSHPACDDVLLYNERGELTEFTIGNLVVEIDGKLVTPPVDCGLLPGTFRAYLLETGQVVEKVIPLRQLEDCTKIYRVNSVRTWQSVRLLQIHL
jgi:para-aminobenzoate synthetase/4-amino-4-deoxychorismate lyase